MKDLMATIKRICDEKRVDHGAPLYFLLKGLLLHHATHASGINAPEGQQPRPNVSDEIAGMMNLAGQTEAPVSILATLDMIAKLNYQLDAHNVKAMANPTPAAESTVRAGEALILILRELMNDTERRGIEFGLRLDAARDENGNIDINKL